MDHILSVINNIKQEDLKNIGIALAIMILFKVFSDMAAYLIIRIFKINVRKSKATKEVKESAFYKPLSIFFTILGIYIGILYLKKPLYIPNRVMDIVTTIFKVVSIIAFTKGLASSFVEESSLAKKIANLYKKEEDDKMFSFILKIIRFSIYIIGFIAVIIVLGFNISSLVAGLGLGGVIITLAAQDTAKNLFGGAVIFLDKPFSVGDWIAVDSYEGTVEDITFRSTRIRTFENSVVNIPNANISNTSVTNWSKMEKRRYKTNISIELDTPLEKLQAFKYKVEEMLKQREAILEDSIIVKFDLIKNNSLNILIYSFADCVDYVGFLTEKENINYKIMKILKEENIKLSCDEKVISIKNSLSK